jgi:hypothetical protein
MTRILFLFVISTAMAISGLWLIAAESFLADRIYFRFAIAGAMLVTLGIYLLCVDFIALVVGIKTGEELGARRSSATIAS